MESLYRTKEVLEGEFPKSKFKKSGGVIMQWEIFTGNKDTDASAILSAWEKITANDGKILPGDGKILPLSGKIVPPKKVIKKV